MYPNMTGSDVPKPWFIKDGFRNDDRVRLDEGVSGNNNDGYRLDDNSMVRFTVAAVKDEDTECTNDFDKSTLRGYVNKSTDWMARANSGVEMTAYFKMSDIDQSDSSVKGNPIIMKGPTGEHHSNTDCCSGSAHMVHIGGEDEDWENDIAMRFSKEMWHVHYITRSDYKTIGINQSFLDMGWVGFKYIIYKKTVNGEKAIQIDVYIDENADKQSWKKVLSTTDAGGWGDKGDDCNGDSDDKLAFGNARMMLRWDHRDGNDLRFKWVSIREINPNGTFEVEDPVVPDTNVPTVTTIRKSLRLQRNINSDTGVGCGITGDQEFWNIERTGTLIARDLSNSVDDDYRDIVASRANPAGGSGMKDGLISRVDASIRKNGSPTGTVYCKIWSSSGSELFAAPGITASTLPTSFGTYTTFDFSGNTHILSDGERVGIQWTGSDSSNNVSVECRDPGDGSSGSFYTAFYDDTNTWDDIEDRDVILILYKTL